VYYLQGRYREATEQMERAVKLGGGDYRLWGNLANAYERLGGAGNRAREAYEKAIEHSEQQLGTNPVDGELRAHLAYYLAKTGRSDRARREADEAIRTAGGSGAVLFRSALALEALGDRRRALETLGRAVAAGHSLQEIENVPDLGNLRRDPEYEKVVRKRAEPSRRGD
jgi:tetratricopeptide (TPR) repeat protein